MKKIVEILLLLACFCFVAVGCAPQESAEMPIEKINVAMLKGPTGLGALDIMDNANYNVSVVNSPDEAMAGLINGEYQISALPTNVAAMLAQKTSGDVMVAAVNTLGVLYVLEDGNTVNTVNDLSGKTIYVSGQGATPEYALKYILEKNGITDCNIQFMQDHAQLAAAILAGEAPIALLPEPNVTSVLLKNPNVRIALDLNEQWEAVSDGSGLAMGCIAVSKDFYEQNTEAFKLFLEEYSKSVAFVNENVPEAAALAESYGIIPSKAAAEKAIPNCSIVCITGEEMKQVLSGFYEVLYNANPKSVGGKLPDEAFYITK